MNLTKIIGFIISALLNILGGSILSISIIFWFNYFNHPYGIMLLSTFSFLFIILIICLIFVKFEQWKITFKEFFLLTKMGILNALGGLFITYSSQPDRLSPVFQQFLISTIIFFSIFCNKIIIKDQKKYLSFLPILSLFLIISSSIIYSIALILNNTIKESWYELLFWIFINLIGQFVMALFSVYQTLYINTKIQNKKNESAENFQESSEHHFNEHNESINLTREEMENKNKRQTSKMLEKLSQIIIMLLYSKTIQFLTYIIMYPVDFIPYFGISTRDNFFDHLIAIFECNFTLNCDLSIIFYIIFVVGYSSYYFSNAYFNVISAPFSSMFSVLISPIVIIFWLIFPGLDSNSNELPIYIPVISIILNVCGMIIWRLWENKPTDSNKILNRLPFLNKYIKMNDEIIQ